MLKLLVKTIVFILFEIIMTILIPLLDFYIGIKYFNNISCDVYIFIKMPIWLIIKGVFASISTLFIFIIIIFGKNTLIIKVSKNILITSNIILALWIVTGAIIFWDNCLYLKPINVDVYIWFSILFGVLYITNLKIALNFGDKIDKIPLLDIN